MEAPYIRSVAVVASRVDDANAYPFTIPAVRSLDGLRLAQVTYFVGENGSGKSTVLEAIAVAAGYNAEGGTTNFNFATRRSESQLHRAIRLVRNAGRPRTGYFLRAESFFNVATEIEQLDAVPAPAPPIVNSYGSRSLHEQSHGESFLALLKHRFGARGLYLLDEPEAALSPSRQVSLLGRIHQLVQQESQFVIATHSPIVLAYPNARIYRFDESGISKVAYEEVEHVTLTREFLNNRDLFVQRVLNGQDDRD